MEDYNTIAKNSLEQYFNIGIEIETMWAGKVEKVEKLYLPKHRQELLIKELTRTIENKRNINENIYIGQIGSDRYNAETLLKTINKYSTANNIDLKDINILIDTEEEDVLQLNFKQSYSPIQIDILAKGMYEKEVYRYKDDYRTFVLIDKTKNPV